MSTSEVFKQFYHKLVVTLPMNDVTFTAQLVSRDLLPGNLSDQVKSLATSSDKAAHFLDCVIKPAVTIGVDRSFNELLNIMEDSEYCNVKELALQIRSKLKGGLVNATALHSIATTTESNSTTSEPPTKKAKESTALDVAADGLRTRYIEQLPTAKADWPKHLVTSYIRLALVIKEDVTDSSDQLNYIITRTLRGGVDRILKKRQPIYNLREIFHYNNQPIPRLILLMGGPGIGKTTLANEICVKWARDGFLSEDFTIVILVTLRTVQQRSLEDVVKKLIGENAYQLLKESLDIKCLIILEGLDEMAVERRQNDSLLMELVKNVSMEFVKARIVITSRPNACQVLIANRTIEIIGLGDKEIMEFVQNSFPGDTQSVEAFSKQLDDYPQLYFLCYVPMSLVMIVRIFKYKQQSLPPTSTELYRLFVVMTLIREEKKKWITKHLESKAVVDPAEEILCKVFPDVPSEEMKTLLTLCKLAYCGFFKWHKEYFFEPKEARIIFTKINLIQSGIEVTDGFDGHGLLQVETLYQLTGDCVTYNFVHLTVQEFLCAAYMLTLSQEEQYHLLNEYFYGYPNIMILYCGLTKLNFHQVVSSKLTSHYSTVTAVKCLYEGQQNIATHFVSPFVLDMSHITLLSYDCHCLSYVLCHYPVTNLSLVSCHMGNKNAEILANWCYKKSNTKLQSLKLSLSNLTCEKMKHVMKIVTSSPSLRVLDVGGNNIGDDGIALCLQHINTLTELIVWDCELSVKGATYIKKMLMENKNLTLLNIGYNNISNDGVRHVTEALQQNVTLTMLDLHDCEISAKGAISISEMIKINHTLRFLNINGNHIGDEGIAAIATNLRNSMISKLYVRWCEITLTGAKALAGYVAKNNAIKILNVQGNDITVNGAIAILEAAVSNNVCEEVWIEREYKSNDKVKEMMGILEQRKSQEEIKMKSKDVHVTMPTDYHREISTKDDQPQEDTIC